MFTQNIQGLLENEIDQCEDQDVIDTHAYAKCDTGDAMITILFKLLITEYVPQPSIINSFNKTFAFQDTIFGIP